MGRAREPEEPSEVVADRYFESIAIDPPRAAEAMNRDASKGCGARKRDLAETKDAERSDETTRLDECQLVNAFRRLTPEISGVLKQQAVVAK